MEIKTVLGNVLESEVGITLPHEHITCYSEFYYKMAGKIYLDKNLLLETAVKYLKEMKEVYNLSTFIDCTPVNIGRDVELLKEVAKNTGVNIICSTGFYCIDDAQLVTPPIEKMVDFIVADAKNVNAGILKCAIENEVLSDFDEKILRAIAKAQKILNLPIVMHSNGPNKNGKKGLEILLSEDVKPQAITVGHLSDTYDIDYIKEIASYGCFIGLDRLYGDMTEERFEKDVNRILALFDAGYGNQVLLSHDGLVFNGFRGELQMEELRFAWHFKYILPKFSKEVFEKIMVENPLKMLKCGE